jgi:hypothetical protein
MFAENWRPARCRDSHVNSSLLEEIGSGEEGEAMVPRDKIVHPAGKGAIQKLQRPPWVVQCGRTNCDAYSNFYFYFTAIKTPRQSQHP